MSIDRRDFRKRKQERIKIKDRILIVCEGEKTEPNYFKAFRHGNVIVKVKGVGKNTINLINEAIRLKNNAVKDKEPYDKIWCVFDIDDNSEEHINSAINLAIKHNIEYVYSNEAFELWYLLHYDYHNVAISRRSYEEKLSGYLGAEYKSFIKLTELRKIFLKKIYI